MTGRGRIVVTGKGFEPGKVQLEFEPDELGVNVFVTLSGERRDDMVFEVHMPAESFAVLLEEIRLATMPEELVTEITAEQTFPGDTTKPSILTIEDTLPDAPALQAEKAPGSVDIQLPTRPPILMRVAGGDGHAIYLANAVFKRVQGWGAIISEDMLPA
jgi:hypothetical protein